MKAEVKNIERRKGNKTFKIKKLTAVPKHVQVKTCSRKTVKSFEE